MWPGVRPLLESAGHDVIWSGDWPHDPGDEAILAYAHRERRVVVTLDSDFGQLAIHRGLPHSGILRITKVSVREQASLCEIALRRHGIELELGAIVTVNRKRTRVRPPSEDRDSGGGSST